MTQFITNPDGKRVAIILPMEEYEKMIEDLEMLEDIKLYDEAKKEDDGERILFSDYLKKRELRNA